MSTRATLLLAFAGCGRVLIGEANDAGPDLPANDLATPDLARPDLAPVCQAPATIAFAAPRIVKDVPGAVGPAIGDLDGDGHADLAVAVNPWKLAVFYGFGDGNFGDRHDLATSGNYPEMIAIARFGQGAHPSLVTGTFGGLETFPGAGGRAFAPVVATPTFKVQRFALTELDGDGLPDVAAVVHDDAAKKNYLQVWHGAADGKFAAKELTDVPYNDTFIALGDFDEDGRADAALSYPVPPFNGIDFLLGLPAGGFAPSTLLKGTDSPVEPSGMAAADFDGDGHLDLAFADGQSAAGAIKVLRGRGDGTFLPVVASDAVADAYDLAAGDLDGDCGPDLAVTSITGNSVTVLRNLGQGKFALVATLPVGTRPFYVVLADVTGDGKLDLVTSDYDSAQVSVMVNESQ